MTALEVVGRALLLFGTFTAIFVLFASTFGIMRWTLKKALRALGRFIRAITEE
jgi:hypothetical protein